MKLSDPLPDVLEQIEQFERATDHVRGVVGLVRGEAPDAEPRLSLAHCTAIHDKLNELEDFVKQCLLAPRPPSLSRSYP